MLKNVFLGLLMMASTAFIGGTAFAEEPSLNQVYQSAEAGNLNEAQAMMHQVLSAHPNSGKAHFVEAELLVKQGQLKKAEAELATAERLAPGLSFARPEAVQRLREALGSSRNTRPVEVQPVQSMQQPVTESSIPWGILLIGLGLIAFIAFAARLMAQRNAAPVSAGGVPAGDGPGGSASSYGPPLQPYGAGGMGPLGSSQGPGMGSRVMAGEALMHHFMNGNQDSLRPLQNNFGLSSPDTSVDDMGGTDFGVSDTSSWDDNGSIGDSDWN
jgi:hypothetical protein